LQHIDFISTDYNMKGIILDMNSLMTSFVLNGLYFRGSLDEIINGNKYTLIQLSSLALFGKLVVSKHVFPDFGFIPLFRKSGYL
jgi:hypothetical protein